MPITATQTSASASKKKLSYWLSFMLSFIAVVVYFLLQKNFPSGDGSVLTTDLGQEYIDFFSYYRRVLLGHPEQFLYTFSSSLGGPMLGTWSYYLFSPFNLLLLLTPGKWITVGVWLMMAIKLGLCGLTMAVCLHQYPKLSWPLHVALSCAYALCGYNVAYQLNVMWLDGVFLLPLILLGLTKGVRQHKWWLYGLCLAGSLLTNYYIAYMICLFSVIYFIYLLISLRPLHKLKVITGFLVSSILAAGVNAWQLLPTYLELQSTKATYNSQQIIWRSEYNPVKLLGKLTIGSYSFDQMSSGQANIFIGTSLLIVSLLFFFVHKIAWQQRLTAGIITLCLIASFFIEPLDLLWHGGQFPVWYPSRFSFIFCAWLILLAAEVLNQHINLRSWQLVIIGGLLIIWLGYLFLNREQFDYLHLHNLITTAVFAVIGLLLLCLYFSRHATKLTILTLATLMVAELLVNYQSSLDQIAYTKQSEFWNYTQVTKNTLAKLNLSANKRQRLEKTFNRTNDDPMQFGYAGGAHFNSMQNPIIGQFYDKIGQAVGDNYVAYRYGTQVTDSFLGFGTWLDGQSDFTMKSEALPNLDAGLTISSYRPDVRSYPLIKNNALISTHKNPNALNLIFAANQQILKTRLKTAQPVLNQEKLVNGLLGQPEYQPFFSLADFEKIQLQNTKQSLTNGANTYTQKEAGLPATMTYTFTPKTNDAYYLNLSNSVDHEQISITVNDKNVPITENFREPILLNVARNAANQTIKIVVTLKQNQISLPEPTLYHLDQTTVDQDFKKLQTGNAKLTKIQGNQIHGQITLKHQQILMTTIPQNSGWHLKIDGKRTPTKTALRTFIAAKVKPGKHQFTLTFIPDGWYSGWLMTIVSLLMIIFAIWRTRRSKHQRTFPIKF